MADPRVEVVVADVGESIAGAPEAAYDVVLLDVDNGPGYLVHDANAALYEVSTVRAVHRALAAGGVCVIWSAAHDPGLHDALVDVFGDAAATAYEVDLQGRAEHYWLHVAHRHARWPPG